MLPEFILDVQHVA